MISRFIKSIILIGIFYIPNAICARNLLLECLAKEEENFHKQKAQGALYRLNQNFLNELSTNNDITIKKNFIDEICHSKTESPSVGFLRLLLVKEEDIYDLSLSNVDPSMRSFKMGYINEFQKQVPHLLISYLTGISSEQKGANCLLKAIPEISFFTEKIKYLEDEISIHQIMKDKKKINAIFSKLKTMKTIQEKCEKENREALDLIEKKNQKARLGEH